MAVLILDPLIEQQIRTHRRLRAIDRWDEVWDGLCVIAPSPDNEHRRMVLFLMLSFGAVVGAEHGDQVLPGANVSDSEDDWMQNYRIPDILVCLAGGLARDYGSHLVGGPDLAVEIESPGEDARHKLGFYAAIKTRELLVIDRRPWAIEMYQLSGDQLVSVGRSDAVNGLILASSVLPLTFQLRDGSPRPTLVLAHTCTSQVWVV